MKHINGKKIIKKKDVKTILRDIDHKYMYFCICLLFDTFIVFLLSGEVHCTCCNLSNIMLIKGSQDGKLRLEILVLKINFSRNILPQRSFLIRTCITTQGDTG